MSDIFFTTPCPAPCRCHECGTGTVIPITGKDRWFRYKDIPKLYLPNNILIPTCNQCGALWIDSETVKEIDNALEITYQLVKII